jgi:hypothetical protein
MMEVLLVISCIMGYIFTGVLIVAVLERNREPLSIEEFVGFAVIWPSVLFVTLILNIRKLISRN